MNFRTNLIARSINKFFFISLISLSPFFNLNAQIEEVKKLEIDINKKQGEDYAIINLHEKGLVTVLESEEILKQGKREIIFTKYDTTLQKQWKHTEILENTQNIFRYHIDQEYIWFLIKKENYEYKALALNILTGKTEVINYERIMDLNIQLFKPANGLLYLGGTIDEKPAVLRYDPSKKTPPKVLSSINQLKAEVKEIIPNPADSSVYVLLAYPYQSKGIIYINKYNYFGKLISNIAIEPIQNYRVLTWQPYLFNNQELYLFGTYSYKSRGKAQGIYIGRPETPRQTFRFYDFSNMKQFYSYLSERRRNKLQEKINSKQQNDRLYFHDKSMFIRDLRITKDRIFMMGETYIPIYDRTSASERLWFGMAGNYSLNRFYNDRFRDRQFSDGKRKPLYYKYKHANVWAFDHETNLLWDNCLKLEDSEVVQPQALTQYYSENDSLTMMYLTEEEIFTTKTAGENEVTDVRIFGLDSKNDTHRYIDRKNDYLRHWYGKYFIYHGIRKLNHWVQNEHEDIFYIGKIKFKDRPKK